MEDVLRTACLYSILIDLQCLSLGFGFRGAEILNHIQVLFYLFYTHSVSLCVLESVLAGG